MSKEKNKESKLPAKKKRMTATEFDEYVDNGGDLRGMLKFRRVADMTQLVNVDIPNWALASIDREAKRRGVPRKSLIKMWIIDRVDELKPLSPKK
jgi:hypothetical protein